MVCGGEGHPPDRNFLIFQVKNTGFYSFFNAKNYLWPETGPGAHGGSKFSKGFMPVQLPSPPSIRILLAVRILSMFIRTAHQGLPENRRSPVSPQITADHSRSRSIPMVLFFSYLSQKIGRTLDVQRDLRFYQVICGGLSTKFC